MNVLNIGSSQNMTTRLCIDLCQKEYGTLRYAGLVGGNICKCLDEDFLKNTPDLSEDTNCDVPCSGDENDVCGGASNWYSVYDVTLGVCDDPGVPYNGSVSNDVTRTFQFGSIVSFICDTGFILVGSPSIQCILGTKPNETTWNSPVPICKDMTEIAVTTPRMTFDNISNDAIAGGTAGALLIVILVLITTLVIYRSKKRAATEHANEQQGSGEHGEVAVYTEYKKANDGDQAYEALQKNNSGPTQFNDGIENNSSDLAESKYEVNIDMEKHDVIDHTYFSPIQTSVQSEATHQETNESSEYAFAYAQCVPQPECEVNVDSGYLTPMQTTTSKPTQQEKSESNEYDYAYADSVSQPNSSNSN
ncbi:uncharacterized protein [Amphiura filiformis]|uniref:uncharacterized protein n=1 Tax=Amphiura filiformis TaxID=82378 RepID=UPI003B223A3B